MPANLPSSFASAAAGQNANRDTRGARGDGRGTSGGDWSRRDGRSANGTLTLRRPSTTPVGQASQNTSSTEHAVQQPVAAETIPAQHSNHDSGSRYSKEELLDVFRSHKPSDDPSRLFISGWDPSQVNGGASHGWGKVNETHVPQEPGVCWDHTGQTFPLGLQQMTIEEKEAVSSDINSPLKPPSQNKELHQGNVNGRKASLSQGSGNSFGVISPSTASRPGTRRRETVDSNPFNGGLASPTTTGRFSRDDSSPWTQRKSHDLRESEPDDTEVDVLKAPANRLPRSYTSGNVLIPSMWQSANPTTPGGGGFGNFALPSSSAIGDKRVGGGVPGSVGSRLAHLMPKDAGDSPSKVNDNQNLPTLQSWRTRPRTDTDPFGNDELSGSAVLGGAQDTSSGGQFSASRVGVLGTPVKGSTGDFGMSGLNIVEQPADHGSGSPSGTNPYRSPLTEIHDQGDAEAGNGDASLGIAHNDAPANFGSISRGFAAPTFEGSDRSQTSSVGAKGYALGSLSSWPAPSGPTTGTPDRDRPNFSNVFGGSFFSPIGDLHSPSLSNLGNVFGPTGGGLGAGSMGRGSKLGSLFPAAMQAQMQGQDPEQGVNEAPQTLSLGPIGRGTLPAAAQESGSPLRPNRGVFEDLFPSNETGRSQTAFSAPDNQPGGPIGPQSFTPVTGGLPFGGVQSGVELPPAQVRQMVMPDRMRWVYLDPQGQVQGPFTGLEMNDWYKANFFTPDLRVKKVEDPEFEPLGQLIRRIGNSREPFLVPQIGIPHGPAPQGGPFSPSTGGGVVPPLSGVFPSFGRTLTAEEQNNLERRKQEEQYMMAQQRDYMLRQQAMPKFPLPPPGPVLQHHSSAQSLQSQPSFGSMTSPIGVPPQLPPIGAAVPQQGGFPESQVSGSRGVASGEQFRPDQLPGLSAAEKEVIASYLPNKGEASSNQHHAADAGFRLNLPTTEQLSEDQDGFRGRLTEFEELRAQHEAESSTELAGDKAGDVVTMTDAALVDTIVQRPTKQSKSKKKASEEALLSLTQQVQKTQAAAAASFHSLEPGMPMPFPPPSSTTPLPAPTAQRARSNLPDQYSRSQNGTPDASQPPPLAPWAKEPGHEGQRGPSLKEIQEAEARKAAKAEEVAAALRKATMEHETTLLREREKQSAAAAAAASLPASSTWGHGSPASAASPWTKPGSVKAAPSGPAVSISNSKKTLAEIQREEESRKQKAKDEATQSGAQMNLSKSYANLAGKPGVQAPAGALQTAPPPGSGWATVGAGGKIKAPTAPAAGHGMRSLSSGNIKGPVTAAPLGRTSTKPASGAGPVLGKSETGNIAMEEFNKWVHRELSRGITSDISSFQTTLEILPMDTSIIADAIYASSTTMDGRHFAAEYVRRKKLAEKGIVEKQPLVDASKNAASGGGWSEVAKRTSGSQPKESEGAGIQGSGFKVVPSRKKGKK